jgi:transcriptional regulator GlxA family with amidase domain
MKNDSSSSAVLSELREANLKLMAEILTLHQGYQVMLNAKRQALIDEMREVKKARELSAQMRRTGGSEPGIFDKKV